jgi:hypothetical protein
LEDDVQHHPIRSYRSPQIVRFAADPQVQMPAVAWRRAPATQLGCEEVAELQAPASNRLIGHDNPAHREQLLDCSLTERKVKVEVDGMTDNRGWEAMSTVE